MSLGELGRLSLVFHTNIHLEMGIFSAAGQGFFSEWPNSRLCFFWCVIFLWKQRFYLLNFSNNPKHKPSNWRWNLMVQPLPITTPSVGCPLGLLTFASGKTPALGFLWTHMSPISLSHELFWLITLLKSSVSWGNVHTYVYKFIYIHIWGVWSTLI